VRFFGAPNTGQSAKDQLESFVAEARKKYILTDEDFAWKDWSPTIAVDTIVGGGTVVMQNLRIQKARYLHVGHLVKWRIEVWCEIVVGGGTSGARIFLFTPPPVKRQFPDGDTYLYVGNGKIRACYSPLLSTPQTGSLPAYVEVRASGDFGIVTPPGTYIYTAATGVGGFAAEGFYETDILPLRLRNG
jgi:hypothetical protein